jgi:putative endonuclease
MYYVYVLKSQKWNKPYIGFTNDLIKRVKQHNNKNTKSTRYGIPWKLTYYEAYLSEYDARKRELQLKKYGSAFGFLKKRIKRSLDRI